MTGFIEGDEQGCCGGKCPDLCGCKCTRHQNGKKGVLIQKKTDPDCYKCYATNAAHRKIYLAGLIPMR